MVNFTTVTTLLAIAAAATALPGKALHARQADVSCLDNDGVFVAPGIVSEAVDCINELALKGSQDCTAGLTTSFCRRGNTQITGIFTKAAAGGPATSETTTTTCQDVAQAAGRIMDFCSQGSGNVKGQTTAFANTDMLVDIRLVEQ